MSKFNETYERLLAETRRAHYTRREVEEIFNDLMQSVGPYAEKSTWPAIEGNDATKNLSDIKEYDALKLSVAKMYGNENRGIQAAFKDDLKKDGYHILVALADELDLWREDAPLT